MPDRWGRRSWAAWGTLDTSSSCTAHAGAVCLPTLTGLCAPGGVPEVGRAPPSLSAASKPTAWGSETTQVSHELLVSPKQVCGAQHGFPGDLKRQQHLDHLTEQIPGSAGVCSSERWTGQLHVGPFHTARQP